MRKIFFSCTVIETPPSTPIVTIDGLILKKLYAVSIGKQNGVDHFFVCTMARMDDRPEYLCLQWGIETADKLSGSLIGMIAQGRLTTTALIADGDSIELMQTLLDNKETGLAVKWTGRTLTVFRSDNH
jgi:hypothetical protein